MKDVAGESETLKPRRGHAGVRQWGGKLQLCRPRSLRARRFQRPRVLHPYCPNPYPCKSVRPDCCKIRRPLLPGSTCAGPANMADSSHRVNSEFARVADRTKPKPSQNCLHRPNRSTVSAENKPVHSRCRSGPKSGTYLVVLMFQSYMIEVGGARVLPVSAAGGGPAGAAAAVTAGKPCGQAHQRTPAARSFAGIKRAYRRARLRAATAASGGTWYKGQWHTTQTLGALPLPKQPLPRRKSTSGRDAQLTKHNKLLSLISWNSGGLSSALYHEFMMWCDMQPSLDLAVVQETHWGTTGDFVSGKWLAMHSAGSSDPEAHSRYGGILLLLNQTVFKDPKINEVVPGRLVMVQATLRRTNLPVAILGVYQHVWRSHLSTSTNQALRHEIWSKLAATLTQLPQRCEVILCGDFNSSLQTQPGVVGPAILPNASTYDKELQTLLADQALVVLNSWHDSSPATYYGPTGRTQIDFVAVRRRVSGGQAKWARSLEGFPVGAHRNSGHYPVHAELRTVPFYLQSERQQTSQPRVDLPALQQAVTARAPEALDLQRRIADRLQEVSSSDLNVVQKDINHILLQEASLAFPPKIKKDDRISAHPTYQITARQTWDLYRLAKRPRVCTVRGIWRQWHLLAQFAKASAALRQCSKVLKQQMLHQQVSIAESAAARGDQRTLYSVVRRLTPKTQLKASRMKDCRGRLLSSEEQLTAIIQYGDATFAAQTEQAPTAVIRDGLQWTAKDITLEVRSLGIGKAVPKHVAPTPVWRLCADAIAPVLNQAFTSHFASGQPGNLDGDWRDTHVVWLPKSSKPPCDVKSMRPIGLQCPTSKILAGLLRAQLLQNLLPLLQYLPQYAFTRGRGTADALTRAHQHFREVADLIRQNRVDRFQLQAGKCRQGCQGGMGLSLDLSRAFDCVNRDCIYATLEKHGVHPDVILVIQRLHYEAKYHYSVGDHRGQTCTSNGIKQGCKIAPYLWSYFTVAFMLRLREARDQTWLERTMTMFADDCWNAWLIRVRSDLDQAVADLQLILETLETMHMSINYKKTAVLIRLVGREAKSALHACTYKSAGQLYLRVQVHGRECGIPVKTDHEYLGSIISYQRRLEKNTAHRLKAGQGRYQNLRKALNGTHHLSQQYRIRLWQACVCSSIFYSQHVVGFNSSTLRRITVELTRHLRAILRLPAHLTRITNAAIWERAGLAQPGWTMQHALQQHQSRLDVKATTAPDITTAPRILCYLKETASLMADVLLQEAQSISNEVVVSAAISCPMCEATFVSENAMRIHSKLKHKTLPAHSTRTPTIFVPHLHAVAGMPQCKLCDRQFFKWRHLKLHIEGGACPKLGGDSFIRSPLDSTQALAKVAAPPAADLPQFAGQNVTDLPLVLREAFLSKLSQWECWLSVPSLMTELRNYCSLCHQWVADFRHVKQHIRKEHQTTHGHLFNEVNTICKTFKSHLTRDRTCIFCGHRVGAPGRHIEQCTPLFQLVLAVVTCRRQQDVRGHDGGGGGARGEHLRALFRRGSHAKVHAGQGAQAGSPGTAVSGDGCGKSLRSCEHVWSAPAAAAGAGPASSHVPRHPATGGDHSAPSAREVLCHVHETRAGRDPQTANDGGERVERETKPDAGEAHLSTPYPALAVNVAGTLAKSAEGGGHRRWPNSSPEKRLADQGKPLAVSCLGLQNQATCAEPGPAACSSHGDRSVAHLDADRDEGGHNPDLQVPPQPPQDEPSDCADLHLPPGDCLAGSNLVGDARGLHEADIECRDTADRHRYQAGQPAADGPCQAIGGPHLPPSMTGLTPPAIAQAATCHFPLSSVVLQGGRNQCYLNSFLYCFLHAARCADCSHVLPQVFGKQTGKAQWASRLLGFGLLGWPEPYQQHDVAELGDFLLPKLTQAVSPGHWESRSTTDQGFVRHASTSAAQCLRLGLDEPHSADAVDIQVLIAGWHQGATIQAFVRAPPMLCIQIPRFLYRAPGWAEKRKHPYLLPNLVQIPEFLTADNLSIRWLPYQVVACVQHHGAQPHEGHYTAVLQQCGKQWLYDDEKRPRLLETHELEHLSTNIYLVFLVRQHLNAVAPFVAAEPSISQAER